MKTTQAFAQSQGNIEKSNKIKEWFEIFEKILKDFFYEQNLILDFDIDTFEFNINLPSRESFNFNQLSSGYSAIFKIITDLMIRMEKISSKFYNIEGIVLIDELDSHLHLDLQKKIFPLLTTIFPEIQFIVSTHSPFILNSSNNVVIYDLENNIEIQDGLKKFPYSAVVEGYFEVNSLSNELEEKFNKYKELANKDKLTSEDYVLISEIEIYLDKIPDYLAFDISCEYNRLKLKLEESE